MVQYPADDHRGDALAFPGGTHVNQNSPELQNHRDRYCIVAWAEGGAGRTAALTTRPRRRAGVFVVWCLNSGYKYLQERIKNEPIERGWGNG